MTFPVLGDPLQTLHNWSIRLNRRFRELQDNSKQYKLNREIDTGFTWVNNRKIYRKTFFVPSLPNTTSLNTDLNIESFSTVVNVYGIAFNEAGTVRPLPYVDTSAASLVELRITNNAIVIVTAADYTTYSAYIHVEFVR